MEEKKRTYPIKYVVDIGKHVRDKFDPKSQATADAIVYMPIIRKDPLDPYCAEKIIGCYTIDGYKKEPITDHELFQIFTFLADTLSKSGVLQPWQHAILKQVMGTIDRLATAFGTDPNSQN